MFNICTYICNIRYIYRCIIMIYKLPYFPHFFACCQEKNGAFPTCPTWGPGTVRVWRRGRGSWALTIGFGMKTHQNRTNLPKLGSNMHIYSCVFCCLEIEYTPQPKARSMGLWLPAVRDHFPRPAGGKAMNPCITNPVNISQFGLLNAWYWIMLDNLICCSNSEK